ncbi:hypothetical protein AB7Y49_16495 [Providencia vermicola]|uniref:Uncharacterized protein n=1 Tax=Providencia vermicola TaxID=333965 RepID=A0AAX3RUV6_9GAMM|nr:MULTISPECIES: hypothetical protein [Providencia]ELX8380367.1 hypothetical protein [Providencia stuartii]EMD5259904.1 hypothetical protein [Providencia stuartii]USB37496.1 hypothetical protein M5J11_02990 [Providencia vermicola]WFC06429.1 hypothetical protein PG365_17345 [Providencia vermicola]
MSETLWLLFYVDGISAAFIRTRTDSLPNNSQRISAASQRITWSDRKRYG